MTAPNAYRKLTQEQLSAEATERFGRNPKAWKFRCPSCGDEASAQDFIDAGSLSGMVGQECIGRTTAKPRGCTWVAYGLIAGPWEVVVPAEGDKPERSIWGFPLADGPRPDAAS